MNGFVETGSPVILVTLVYLLLYYVFLLHGLRVKLKVLRECREKGERFDRYNGDYPELRASDRIQLNMLEHLPTFLIALWTNAWVVSAEGATLAGIVWLLARVAYPFLIGRGLGRDIPLRVLIATFTGYGAIAYLAGAVIWALVR